MPRAGGHSRCRAPSEETTTPRALNTRFADSSVNTDARAGASDQLSERAEQRKVQCRAHRLRSHRACQLEVSFELRPIALDFLREKPLEIAALVRARLVVDDPADAGFIDETAIDLDVAQPAPAHPAQVPL